MEEKKIDPIHISIKNFQSIENLEFEVRGFTCITGKTNIGKSAIVRALSSAIENHPVVGMVRQGAKFCSVEIHSAGWGFVWEKGEKGGGSYRLDGSDKIYDKIGQGPLDEITKLGFETIRIGDENSHPWYANQFEPVFLLNKSGPAVTEFISDVSRLNVLQDSIILSLREKKRALESAKNQELLLEKLRFKESLTEGLDITVQLWKDLEEQSKSISSYESHLGLMEKLQSELDNINRGITFLNPLLQIKIPQIPIGVQRFRKMFQHWLRLEESAKRIISVRGIQKIKIPDAPIGELASYKRIMKYNNLQSDKTLVENLQRISSVSIPSDSLKKDFSRLKLMKNYQLEIDRSRRFISKFDSKIKSTPRLDADLTRVKKAEVQSKAISNLKSEIAELELSLESVYGDLNKIREEIDSLPSCGECGRPLSGSSHQKMTKNSDLASGPGCHQ